MSGCRLNVMSTYTENDGAFHDHVRAKAKTAALTICDPFNVLGGQSRKEVKTRCCQQIVKAPPGGLTRSNGRACSPPGRASASASARHALAVGGAAVSLQKHPALHSVFGVRRACVSGFGSLTVPRMPCTTGLPARRAFQRHGRVPGLSVRADQPEWVCGGGCMGARVSSMEASVGTVAAPPDLISIRRGKRREGEPT